MHTIDAYKLNFLQKRLSKLYLKLHKNQFDVECSPENERRQIPKSTRRRQKQKHFAEEMMPQGVYKNGEEDCQTPVGICQTGA
ncbi:hypothetical protein GCK72_022569 [Caenorhabditis remanei]|uniref:Uncharacterized protein n=1 Tax=Caenorhabditis remanei TaxID=31234 RepID=A0A6A5FU56_CAERE|nr:hypothetical protein GCK72_022569 [Caenorhabditis remanei]KAF1746117.1 hypothetical protein GCK72_022569 [Caenorhabditis remanei]